MNRNALDELLSWKNDIEKKPLVVWGARQVGKTYLIKDIFAEQFYLNNYIYIDFKQDRNARNAIDQTVDAGEIIRYLALRFEKEITEDTLLIFDEVQECPNIITSLKYFCQNFRNIPVIATGSMVRIKLQRDNKSKVLFPVGKIDQITIYPMTFDEFLMNKNKMLYEEVKKKYQQKMSLDMAIHSMIMNLFYEYLLIGGMPEAVDYYLRHNDLLKTRGIIKDLYDNYLADMSLYQISDESLLRTRLIYQNIYRQLNKESKNFSPSLIQEKLKNRDLISSIEWLKLSHVVQQSFQLKEHVTTPLMEDGNMNYRLYLGDIGMFSYQSGINASSFVTNSENTLAGIFFENYVATELAAKGIQLFYWRGKRSNELEFIVESNGELYPFDVKKNKGRLTSLVEFGNHNKYNFAIKVSNNNFGYNKEMKLMTIPYYYIPFLAEDLASGTLK